MNCPTVIIQYMHEYLDEELSTENEKILKEHLHACTDCQTHIQELKRTATLLRSTANVKAPEGFTAGVMANLPKEKKRAGFQRYVRQHPFFAAAAVFILLMSGSLFSSWNDDGQFSVSKQPNLIVENGTVIVPKGEVVEGDVLVRNGKLKIEGEVNGDVTVINGEIVNGDNYLASVGHVSGDIKEVNEIFDWLWFKIKTMMGKIGDLSGSSSVE